MDLHRSLYSKNLDDWKATLTAGTLCFASVSALSVAEAQTGQQTAAAPNSVEDIVVTGRRLDLTMLPEKILDTPQSIDVLSHEMLNDQGVSTLQDALKNVPGITLNAGEGGAHGDTINLRGFSASDDFFLDGLRDTGFYTRDPFNTDAVEIYKGPASTLFGRGSTGGVVNQVSKQPLLKSFESGTLTGGTNSEVRGTADINEKFGDSMAARLNVMGQRSDVAGRDYVRVRRYGVAPSFAAGLGEATTFVVNFIHQQEDNIPDYGIPFLFGAPAPVPHNAYYGLPSDDRAKSRIDVVTGKLNHDFGGAFSITDTARYGNYFYDSRQTAPHYGAAPPAPGTPLDSIVTFRDRPSSDGTVKTLMNDLALTYKGETGPLSHTLVAGVALDHESALLTRFANQMSMIAPTPLLAPDPNEAFPGHQTAVTSLPKTVANTIGLYAVDTVKIGRQWEITGAVRFDSFAAHYNEPITQAHFDHTDNLVNPRAAIVYKPTDNQSIYFSYGTSYDPSAENLSLSARTADLGPEKDHTFEVGAKSVFLNGGLALTGALFDTEMTNARVGDPLNATLQVLAGQQRARGAEIGIQGYVAQNLEIQAGYTYLDAKTIKSTDPTQVNQNLPNTAHNQATFWTTYEYTEDIKVGTGVNYLGVRAADASGRDHIPGYVTWDAMASYRVSPHLAFQVNGYNLTDKFYFANAYNSSAVENHVIPGAGRTGMLKILVDY